MQTEPNVLLSPLQPRKDNLEALAIGLRDNVSLQNGMRVSATHGQLQPIGHKAKTRVRGVVRRASSLPCFEQVSRCAVRPRGKRKRAYRAGREIHAAGSWPARLSLGFAASAPVHRGLSGDHEAIEVRSLLSAPAIKIISAYLAARFDEIFLRNNMQVCTSSHTQTTK